MDVFEAIEKRRAVKHFDAGHRLSDQEVKTLIEAAMKSPTAFNLQHWRFVVVTDPERRRQIRAAAWDQAQVTDASLLIVLCADLKAWEKQPDRYWRNAPEAVRNFLVPAIGEYYRGNEQAQRDEALRSCGIAAQTLMLAAKGMGYDSCPMDGFDFNQVARIIRLPADHLISMMIAIGKGTKEPWPRPGQLEFSEVLVRDHF